MKVNTNVMLKVEIESCRNSQKFVGTKYILRDSIDKGEGVVKERLENLCTDVLDSFFSDKNKSISQE